MRTRWRKTACPVNVNDGTTRRKPKEALGSDEFFCVEQERVWSRSWVAAGYGCQIPDVGDVLTADVADQPLILVRNRDGGVRAFHNVCRHRGSRLIKENGNWKLIAENFMEYYHLPCGHPELCNISGFDNHWRYQGPGMYTGMCTSPLSDNPNTLVIDLPTFSGLSHTASKSAYFVHLFPNISLWIFPHHLLTLLFRPSGPGLTIEHVDMLVHPDALARPGIHESLDRIMNFWCFVNDKDVTLVEGVQAGLRSRAYSGGRLCYRFEEPVHRFQNMLIDLMTGESRNPPGDEREEAPILARG